jgi:hypothetical protein
MFKNKNFLENSTLIFEKLKPKKKKSKEISFKKIRAEKKDSVFNLTDFLDHNDLITCTVLFRNVDFNDYFVEQFKHPYGDWFTWIYILNKTQKKVIVKKYQKIFKRKYS